MIFGNMQKTYNSAYKATDWGHHLVSLYKTMLNMKGEI